MPKKILPTSEPDDKAPEPKEEALPVIINPDISRMVFQFYEGSKMGKRDAHEARVLAALWQIALNLAVLHNQSIVNTKALLEPPCPGCGK